jgi:large subunit ribosomal protein L25
METISLDVQLRDSNFTTSQLRSNKLVPAEYYGKGEKNISLQVPYQPLRQVFLKAGYSSLVDLNLGGKSKKVLIHDVQMHPLKGTITHVDFLHVNLKEEIVTEIPIEIVGVAPAVKDLGGTLNTIKHEIEIKCLPSDIPHSVSVDISGLAELSAAIYVKDIILPKGVIMLSDIEEVVVVVNAPRAEEEEAPVTADVAALAGEPAEGAKGEEAEKTE